MTKDVEGVRIILVTYRHKLDSFAAPTDHGSIAFGATATGKISSTAKYHAWTFSLPTTVDPSRVSAEYKQGVLTVRLPLREEAKPRSIKVDVAA